MVQSLFSGSLGIQAHQKAMDVEGNNIANINTVGYKYSRVNFSELLSQSYGSASAPSDGKGGTNGLQVGLGSEVTSTVKIFKQGAIETTESNLDMAISGEGFFVVSGDNGKTTDYSRAGNFDLDVAGNLVNAEGMIVQGWNADNNFELNCGDPISTVRIEPYMKIPAKQTGTYSIEGNLDSSDSIQSKFNLKDGDTLSVAGTTYTYRDGAPGANEFHSAIDLANLMGATISNGKFTVNASIDSISGSNDGLVNALSSLVTGTESSIVSPYYSTSVDVYDSLGEKHTVLVKFDKAQADAQGNNVWNMKIETEAPATIDSTPNGTVTFNTDGSINAVSLASFNITGNNGSSPAQKVSLNFGSKFNGLTSLNQSYGIDSSQDGYASGTLSNISVDENGTLIGKFSNGNSKTLARVAIARFNNNEGLAAAGGGLLTETRNSGGPLIGIAGVNGRGIIAGSSLEMSNVDLSKSLTQLIVVQRGFQASSKTVTTTDTMLDTLMQMKR